MADDPTDEIMRATYCALCTHGYADLTVQDIADQSSRSKAAIHYHYETKQALLEAFLSYLYDSFADRLDGVDGEDALARLHGLIDALLSPPEDTSMEFRTAILEIKAQGPYNDAYRERLREFDALIHDRVSEVLAAGIEEGSIRPDVDPDAAATFFVTVVNGAHTRQVAVGEPVAATRRTLTDYVHETLVADDADPEVPAE